MERRLKWIRLLNNATGGEFKLMQTARGVKIKRDLPDGTLVYVNSHGNIKPMPEPFGRVVTKEVGRELTKTLRRRYGPRWREHCGR